MLPVQQFLLNHSLDDLEFQYGINARFSKDGTKFSLNYDQIKAKDDCELTKDCRGLILRPLAGQQLSRPGDNLPIGETSILAFGMRRFFNHGQGAADQIDWDKDYNVLLKLDGTMVLVYWDELKQEWHCSTRSVPEADLPLNDSRMTFRGLFELTIQEHLGVSFEQFTFFLHQDMTYYFELCTPYNQIVIPYEKCQFFLLGARGLFANYAEHMVDTISLKDHFPQLVVPRFDFRDLDETIKFVNSQKGHEHEGVVVVQPDFPSFKRIKIKNADYLTLNKHIDLFSSKRNVLDFCLSNSYDDVFPTINEKFKPMISGMREKVVELFRTLDHRYQELKHIEHQKDFALAMTEKDWSAPLFLMRKGQIKTSFEYIEKAKKKGNLTNGVLDNILKMIGEK